MERLIHTHLFSHLESQNILSDQNMASDLEGH